MANNIKNIAQPSVLKLRAISATKRKSTTRRGYNYKWQKAREVFLLERPLCVDCMAASIVRSAVVVDHIIPHNDDPVLFWDRENWQGLCTSHHSKKTASRDGGFGNPVKTNGK